MSIIYLDQWVYIKLLRASKGLRPEHLKYAEICKKLIESSQKGINKFPFSRVHLHEAIKRRELSSRKDLIKFIFDLSKFFTIRPWGRQIINLEVKNAVRKSLNFEPINLSNYVFDNELSHCFSSKEEIPEEIKENLFSAHRNSELIEDVFCKDQMRDYVEELFQQDNNTTKKLEKVRREEYNRHRDKKMRHNISEHSFLIDFTKDELIEAILEFDLDYKKYMDHIFSSKESIEAFLKSIPTAYVFHILNDAIDQDIGSSIDPNDICDLGALAIAIPYCDVVVTERKWSNILNQKEIGDLYSTKILHKIEDLSEFV